MKHLAAYLLLGVGGNASPSAKDVKKVLAAVGIEADDDRLKQLISELEGKDINEITEDTSIANAAPAAHRLWLPPEAKEEEKEESDEDMGFGLFD
ncbi:60S acidic ribosomal protein P2 [Ophiocordyceps sinensis CO18]|uniref:60S acidic ribosomal protein P2 n=1 Tax=Ophiocordyceps sinensis (strain Co18 / CGMCC 3.14243) TaxID=911162 RepID=T5AEQ2_OPHSC|nr:60S acidic ribosomal protein P2 [Ophiocordyceps sinensis CO18]